MRTVLLTVLVLPLAACDGGNDAPTIRITEPATAQLIAERDSFVVNLTTVFQSDNGQSLLYEIVSAPAGTVLRNGTRLVVPPQLPGAVQAEVRAVLSAATSARATLHATFAYAGKITAVKAFAPLVLDARKDSAVYDLAAYFAVPPGVVAAYTLSGAPAGVSVTGTTLKVRPSEGGTSNVVVRAGAPGVEAATATLTLTGNADWCATAPAGTVDPLPFSTGQTVRFALAWSDRNDYRQIKQGGTLTWTFQNVSCQYGAKTFRFTEQEVRSDTLYAKNAATGEVTGTTVTPFSETRSYTYTAPAAGVLGPFGSYLFAGFSTADRPARFLPDGAYTYRYSPGFRTTGDTYATANEQGIVLFRKDYSSYATLPAFSALRLTRLP